MEVCSLTLLLLATQAIEFQERPNQITDFSIQKTVVGAIDPKVILLWTYWFESQDWFFDRQGSAVFAQCPEPRCEITSSRSRFNESSIVLLHSRNMNDGDLPLFRFQNQNFMFLSMESPVNAHLANPTVYDGVFNTTATYMRSSEILVSYGTTLLRSEPGDPEDYTMGKNKSMLWFVSTCGTESTRIRQNFVDKLKNFIDIDVYGSCGKRDPCNFNRDCLQQLKSQYWFYLSLENSLCTDYITEKFWVALESKVVPVVMGASFGEYQRVAPPGSFIHVNQFKSIKGLAAHLTLRTQEKDAYNKYMAWRQNYDRNSKL
jgi:hypothetical protein